MIVIVPHYIRRPSSHTFPWRSVGEQMGPNPAVNRTSREKPREAGYLERLGGKSMTTPTITILVAITALVLWAVAFGGRLPKSLRSRTCQGKGWRTTFPSASKQAIREFLSLFVNAFAFSKTERLKLSPNDQVLQIYRAVYPTMLTPDALELETLAKDIEATYGFSLEGVWHEHITLGELFQITQQARAA